MKCPKCGADVREGAKICLNCGYYLNSEDNENNEDDSFDDSFDEYVEGKENNFDDFDNSQDEDTEKSGFKFKKNIIYIILGLILIIALIILIIGLSNKNNKSTPTATSTPEVKTSKKVSVDNYKITVPAGLEYRIGNNIINISDDEAYSFSFKINDGNFNSYSSNMEEIKSRLNNNGYNVISSEKKTISEKEFLIFTLSLGSDVSYLYITEYSPVKICMGVINVHNKSSVNGVCEVVLKVLNTVDMDDDSNDDSSNSSNSVEDSSGINDNFTSLVEGFKSVLN